METTYSLAEIRPEDVNLGKARTTPFRWSYSSEAFPIDFYWDIVENLPSDEAYTDRTYAHRMLADVSSLEGAFWKEFRERLLTFEFLERVIDQYPDVWRHKSWRPEFRLVRDKCGYAIKPHTDVRQKAITCLFYLPKDESLNDYGTRIYEAKDRAFFSDGDARYGFGMFNEVYAAPFLPNSVLSFARSGKSFHGVPEIGDCVRDTLLFNVDVPC